MKSSFGYLLACILISSDARTYTKIPINDMTLHRKDAFVIQSQNNGDQQGVGAGAGIDDYDFIPPEGWQTTKHPDHILLQNLQSGCLVRILAPQQSSGNLEKDARAVFDLMYAGWQYQKSGAQQFVLSKGFLKKGLEYFAMQAGMSKLSADGSRYDGFEEGSAIVVKAGAPIVILSIRHNSSMMGHVGCDRKYETMRRFINSFTVKNIPAPGDPEDAHTRIIGRWTMAESGAVGEYVFAANGNYAFSGATGTSSTSNDHNYEYLHMKTYAFEGDGSYSIAADLLSLKNKNRPPEQKRFRFEKINYGGTGWKDRLWLLTSDSVGDNEVNYERKDP